MLTIKTRPLRPRPLRSRPSRALPIRPGASRTRLAGALTRSQRQQLETFWFQLELLLEGARRHATPFGLTRFCFPDAHEAALFVAENRSRVRTCDAIGEIAEAVVVAWDHADREIAHAATTRLLSSTVTSHPVEVATAAFPDDGLTVSALLAALRPPQEGVRRLDTTPLVRTATPLRRAVDGALDGERAS